MVTQSNWIAIFSKPNSGYFGGVQLQNVQVKNNLYASFLRYKYYFFSFL